MSTVKEKFMNNKDIELNIQNAFDKITPNQLDSILAKCKKKNNTRIIMEEEKTVQYNWVPKLALAAMTIMLMVGGFFVANNIIKTNNALAATISLDVNPSIEININKDEKVLSVKALNADAEKVLDGMDFKGSDLKVTINALIGSLVRNGYINELTNSILISVNDSDVDLAKKLEDELMAEISSLIKQGSVLAQMVNADEDVKKIAQDYGITLGKAQLIKELADKATIYTYEDLAGLSINELNLLSKNLDESQIQRNGQPSDKAYIGADKAKQIALADVGVSEDKVVMEKVELDYEFRKMIYEVEFVYDGSEYEYVIDATSGEIIYVDIENERKYSSNYTPPASNSNSSSSTTTNNNSNLIGEAKAKAIALANAGVSESQISNYHIEREYDDGVTKYEIEFYVGNVEYEYDINAYSGTILKAETETKGSNNHSNSNTNNTPSSSAGTVKSGDDTYKVENGKVYEYDDGRWELEEDKKYENGQIYEYDDGRWELNDDDDD